MTCGTALRELFKNLGDTVLTSEEIYQRLQQMPNNPCTRQLVLDRLQKYSINHPLKKHLRNMEQRSFLFWLGGDRFRNWNPAQDGVWRRVAGEMRLVAGEPTEEEEETDDEAQILDVPVRIERDLEDSLAQNLSMIEAGLKLHNPEGVSGRQFDTNVVGIIDLLAIDKNGSIVVIELKAGKAADKACAQLCRYMGWVQLNVARGKPVRGILVANDFSEGCRYAIKAARGIELKKYEMQFRFSEVPEVTAETPPSNDEKLK